MQAAKWFDPVIGIDVHMVMVPAPPSPTPVPTPLPHPFFGVVFDPLGAAIGAAIGMALSGGGPVLVNGLPAGNTGTDVIGFGHSPMPPGISFAPNDIPGNEGVIVTGSKTVTFGGASEGRLLSMVMSCNFPVNLPTSLCLAVPAGPPVLIGGPDSFDILAAVTKAIRTKWFSEALHKGLKPGPRLSKAICFLTGHPVDVMSGEVLSDAIDFELPGPIPIRFERSYWSRSERGGALGPGWTHPLDASIDERNLDVAVVLSDGRERVHPAMAVGASLWDGIDRYTLERREDGYRLTTWDGTSYHFARVPGARKAYPLVRISDRCDNEITLRYDDGRLAGVTDSAGRELRFSSTAEGRVAGVHFDAMKLDLVRFTYDGEGRLSAAIDALGHAIRYEYRGGVLIRETNRNGLSFYFEYDWYHPQGWCIRTWGDGGIYDRRITYDKLRHVTLVDDSRGGRTHYFGNAAGLVDRIIDPTGRETRYEWDEWYRKTAEIDGLGGRQEWEFDRRGNVVAERDATGATKRWTYDDWNEMSEFVDALGNVFRYTRDRRGKLRFATDPLGNAFEYDHDPRGRLTTCRDPRGLTFSLTYDERSCPETITDWGGNATECVHDELGRLVTVHEPLGTCTRLQWDARSMLVAFDQSDGTSFRMKHDGEGNVVEVSDRTGSTTRYSYSGLNQRTEIIDAVGGIVRYLYDSEERLVGVINERDEEYRFDLDLAGRTVRERRFDGAKIEFRHDAAGRCCERLNGARQRTRFVRDAAGRVVGHIHHGGDRTGYEYDAAGRLIRAWNGECETRVERDPLGRVVRESSGEHFIQSSYDAVDNCIDLRTSLGPRLEYEPGWSGTPTRISVESPGRKGRYTLGIARDVAGNENERHLPGAIRASWERGDAGRPRKLAVLSTDQSILSLSYEWSESGTISAIDRDRVGTTHYEHDARYYLTKAVLPDGSMQLRKPDAAGNVYRAEDCTDRLYAPGGVIVRADGTRHVHDGDGRLIERVLPDGSTWRYAWDDAGQLRSVLRPDGTRVEFSYDPFGRRISKRLGDRSTTYVWSGDQLLGEVDGDGRSVLWAFAQDQFEPLIKIEDGRCYGVVCDHLGTPLALFDDAGGTAWRASIDLFGHADVEIGVTECNWRWPGMYHDQETSLYYNRFRYYDPDLGRYISPDPIRLLGGTNLYAYTIDPLLWTDPFGLVACDKVTRRTRALTADELNHAFDRHAAEVFGRHVSRAHDFERFAALVDRARKSNLTFFWRTGDSNTIAHLARIDGSYVAVQFFRDGDNIGKLATVFVPNRNQLGRMFGFMSKDGP